jgi:hypothetical protein
VIYNATTLQAKGGAEVKIFNNLFTADYNGEASNRYRSNYFSSYIQSLYGFGKLDAGFDVVFKSNLINDYNLLSPFEAVHLSMFSSTQQIGNNEVNTTGNSGVAHIGPKIKFIPFQKFPSLALQQTLYVPIHHNVDGNFISATQFFYNQFITSKQQLFVEATIWQPIGQPLNYPFLKAFYSYYPTNRWTFYGTTTLLYEWGGGLKYQILSGIELELLYTRYLPIAPIINRIGDARTFNVGFRWTK